MQNVSTTKTSKEMVEEIIASVHPEADLSDEEVMFGIILDDYEAYADLITTRRDEIEKATAEGEQRGRRAARDSPVGTGSDGVPALSGTTIADPRQARTIFDLAAMA